MEEAPDHLRLLKIVNYLYAVLLLLSSLLAVAGVLFLVLTAETLEGLALNIVLGLVVALVLFIGAVLTQATGGFVAFGRWRGMQTFLALVNLLNCPLGTIYAIYAMWVCWGNPDTKKEFDVEY